jgi:hypothetical protein
MPVKYEPWGFKKEDDTKWGIRILEGKFENAILSFNDVKLEDTGESNLQLDYSVVKAPDNMMEKYMSEDPEFNKIMGEIMEDILRKAINEYENRESNSTESS